MSESTKKKSFETSTCAKKAVESTEQMLSLTHGLNKTTLSFFEMSTNETMDQSEVKNYLYDIYKRSAHLMEVAVESFDKTHKTLIAAKLTQSSAESDTEDTIPQDELTPETIVEELNNEN